MQAFLKELINVEILATRNHFYMRTISQFWNWFKDNSNAYTFLNTVDEGVKENLNNLLEQLHNYCDKIYFEIGGFKDED